MHERGGDRAPDAWLDGSGGLVERALAAARTELDLDVAYLTEFVGESQVVRATYGNAAAFGLLEGTSVLLEGSYCQRVVDGRLPSVVPDTAGDPVTAALDVTAEASLGAYVGVPVRLSDGTLYGTLCAASTTAVPELAERDVSFMNVLARMLADMLERERGQARDRARLEGAIAAKSDFISTLSHELRTPLNALLVSAELMEREGPRPDHVQHVRHIRQAGTHLLALLGDTLDLARIEAGRLRLPTTAVDPTAAVRDAIAVMAPAAAARDSTIRLADARGDLRPVRAEERRLHQVLLNLLSNAIKYGGGRIVVSCRQEGDHVAIAVADNGDGISAGGLDALFTPFERLGAENGSEEGTGVGLALSRRLVELMEGSLSVTSEPGAGSCFTVRLPAVESTDGGGLPQADSGASTSRRRLRVLHVEDDPGNQHLVQAVLGGRGDVVSVGRGREAVAVAEEERPDVVLLDLRLPDADGLDVLAALSSHPPTADVPVVLVTGATDPDVQRRASELGAAAVLFKPWRIEQLEAIVARVTA